MLAAKKMRNICAAKVEKLVMAWKLEREAKPNIHLNRFVFMHVFPFSLMLYGNENS